MSDKLPVPEPTEPVVDQGPMPEEDEAETVENVENVEEEHFDLPQQLQPILPFEPPTATERKLQEIYDKLYRIEFHLATGVKEDHPKTTKQPLKAKKRGADPNVQQETGKRKKIEERLADIAEKVEKIELRQLNLPVPKTGFGVDVPSMKNSKYHQQPPEKPTGKRKIKSKDPALGASSVMETTSLRSVRITPP